MRSGSASSNTIAMRWACRGCNSSPGARPTRSHGLPAPDAIFIGGGVTVPGVLDACWARLRDGGRLVANAVTLQGEATLSAWRERHGGKLTRIALAQAQPLGGFDTWRQALPITLLEATKGAGGSAPDQP